MTADPRTRWPDGEPDDERAVELFGASIEGTMCPPPELVQASLAGTLPPGLRDRVETHVADCGICRTLIAALQDDSVGALTPEEKGRILKRVQTGIAQHRRTAMRRLAWRWAAAAAVVATAGAGALMYWRDAHDVRPGATEPRADGQPAARRSVFRLEKEELLSLVPSGQPSFAPTDPAERSDLAEALAPYQIGNFGEALKRLRALVNNRPRSGPAHFYLGVTRLHVRQDFRAVPDLEFAQRAAKAAAPYFQNSASWYLATAFVRVGQLDRGRPLLKALCENTGDSANRACAGLQELAEPIRLSGIVTGPDGKPLSGVTVGQHLFRSEDIYLVTDATHLSTRTGTSGRYALFGAPLSLGRPAIIRAAKPGYFTRTAFVALTRDSLADFRLVPWTEIRLGAVVRGTVTPDDTPCGNPNEWCDELALTVPANGTIEVSVEAPDREMMDLYVEAPGGEVYGPQDGEPMRLALPARAGSTFQIRVLSFSAEPRSYELTTRMR